MKRILFAICILLIVVLNVNAQEKPDSTKFKQLQAEFQTKYAQLQKDRLIILQEESDLFKIQEQLTIEAAELQKKALPKKDEK